MVNNTPKTKPIVEMQPILKPCFKIKRGHWKTCRAKNAPYLGRTSPYPPFHWVPPPGTHTKIRLANKMLTLQYLYLRLHLWSVGSVDRPKMQGISILLVIPCLFMQYEKILMVWVRITLGFQPRVIRTQTINIVRIAWEQTGGNEFITQ